MNKHPRQSRPIHLREQTMTPRPTPDHTLAASLNTHQPRTLARARRQGSLLVLVVVCLVLMALLGTAYLQVARVDRFATADYHQNDIDQVANATINYIGKILRDDLVNKDGGFFSQDKGGSAANITATYTDSYGDESYDYPWTNAAGYADKWAVKLDDGSPGTADGGIYDDTWLASNVPTFTGAAPASSWAHISNLMGTYLQIPTTGGPQTPTELPTKAAGGTWNHDTNVTTAELVSVATANHLPLGTDTDMDGVPDAKWQWAPLRQIGSKKYVMAVRIIDNSAMINLAAATSLSSDGDTISTARGYFPSDIDLSRITKRMPSVQPTAGSGPHWYEELATNADSLLHGQRGVSQTALTPLGTASISATTGQVTWGAGSVSRTGAWMNNVRLWGDTTNKLALANEMELRRLAGVNNVNVTTSIENAMPVMLRRDASGETTFDDIAAYNGGLTAAQQVKAFFLGADNSDASNPYSNIAAREFPSLRNQFTTHSATTLYASNAGGVNPLASGHPQRTLKYDLVHGDGGGMVTNNGPRMAAIYAVLHRIFRISDTGTTANSGGTTSYLDLDKSVVAERNTLSDIAYEYALAIQDYSDADRLPSSVTPSASVPAGRTYYSLETLPFFREGYVQAAYQNRDFLDGVGDPIPDTFPDTFVYNDTTGALAFEIANPFDRTIDFDAAAPNPAIRVKVGSNLYPLTGTLDSRQSRVYYANATTFVAEGGEATTRGDLITDLGLTPGPNVVALTPGVTLPANTRVVFELQFQEPGGTWITYDRLTPDLPVSPTPVDPTNSIMYVTSYVHGQPATGADLNLYHFELFRVARPGTIAGAPGPYYISNFGREMFRTAALSDRPAFPIGLSRLTFDDKSLTAEGDPALTDYQLPSANRQFLSVAELGWIHMFGFYTNAGNTVDNEMGDFPARMLALAPNRRRLVLNDSAGPSHTTMRMPHAALLFDQFTTISPRNDGIDNDNDGTIDNEAEQSVRGQININTAPLHLLTLAAPLNETLGDIQQLMQTTLHYRDVPGDRAAMSSAAPTITRTTPGIASIGELMLLDSNAFSATNVDMTTPAGRMDAYSSYTPAAFVGSDANLYPMPEQISATVVQHPTRTDDNEAKLARFQFLSQVFNTRSDTFTAYVRLRGYPSQDFSNGEVESRSFLVVYDRSNIVSASDMPRIVGVYVYNVP